LSFYGKDDIHFIPVRQSILVVVCTAPRTRHSRTWTSASLAAHKRAATASSCATGLGEISGQPPLRDVVSFILWGRGKRARIASAA
jgi:hypothetical protein